MLSELSGRQQKGETAKPILEPFHIAGQVAPLRCCSLTQLSIFPIERQLSSLGCCLAGLVRASRRAVAGSRAGQGCCRLPLRYILDPLRVLLEGSRGFVWDGLGAEVEGFVV